MDCCQREGIETRFDQKYVAKKLERYREKGPKESTRMLIDALKDASVHEMTLLDIGGGIGDIQHELFEAGVTESINCEASSSYIDACKEEAERGGHGAQVTHIKGDFVDVVDRIPSADITTLDRVICCYHDMPKLVSMSLAKTRKLYGFVIPIDKWWLKTVISIYYNLRFLLQRNPFRVFVHSTEALEKLMIRSGFRSIFSQVKGTWLISVYEKI